MMHKTITLLFLVCAMGCSDSHDRVETISESCFKDLLSEKYAIRAAVLKLNPDPSTYRFFNYVSEILTNSANMDAIDNSYEDTVQELFKRIRWNNKYDLCGGILCEVRSTILHMGELNNDRTHFSDRTKLLILSYAEAFNLSNENMNDHPETVFWTKKIQQAYNESQAKARKIEREIEESKKSRKNDSGMSVGDYIVLRYLGF